MECTSPPELDDITLLKRFSEGADEQVDRHLRSCEYCQARLQSLTELQLRLRSALYRVECPAADDLSLFHLNMLSEKTQFDVANHTADCPHCQAELKILTAFDSDEGRTAVEQRTGRRLVIALRSAAGRRPATATVRPAGPAIRGSGAQTRVFRAGEYTVSISVQQDPEHPGEHTVAGLIAGPNAESWPVLLSSLPIHMVESLVQEGGEFSFEHVKRGEYDLFLTGPDIEIVIPAAVEVR